MKIKIIKKFLASLIVAATMIGTISAAVSANPHKNLKKKKNIYDLNECDESNDENGEGEEENEQESEQENYERAAPSKEDIFKFNSLLNKSTWDDFDLEDFLKICMKLSYCDFLGECSLKEKLKATNQLVRCAHGDENQEQIATILLNFSYCNFFKEYPTSKKLDITDILIDLLNQEESKSYAVEAFSYLCSDDFFEAYSADQKTKIARALIEHIHQGEFDNNVMESLAEILNAPDVLKKLTKDEQDTCASITE